MLAAQRQQTLIMVRPESFKYDKQRRLGSGNFNFELILLGTYATVYEGWYNGSEVAVKRFKNADPASLKAYETEMSILEWLRQKSSHPNLVHMFGGCKNEKHSFIVMEIAKHGNIASYLRRNKGKVNL